MPWIERKRKVPTHKCRTPILWWWTKRSIAHGSLWECPDCDTRWIVAGISMRYWSADLHLWGHHRW